MWTQFKIAARSLGHAPGFAILAIAILTLGIGATTAMFSITRTVLLKPLAYREPERLVSITFRVPQFSKEYSAIPTNAQHYQLFRDHARTLEGITLLRPDYSVLTGAGAAQRIGGLLVSANFFDLLGTAPSLGRGFRPGEDAPGRDALIVISYHLWQEQFGPKRHSRADNPARRAAPSSGGRHAGGISSSARPSTFRIGAASRTHGLLSAARFQ
jgi:putative ABC transport system permease protein